MKKLPRAAPESPAWLLEDASGLNGAEAGLAALGAGTQLELRRQQQQWDGRMVQVRRQPWGSSSPHAEPPGASYSGCVQMAFELLQGKRLHNLSGM